MEYIVLGLLILDNMTIYDLHSCFKSGLSMIYAASYGNLQYAVKKLLKDEMIDFDERVENGRNKKIYRINDSGKEHFFNWIKQEISPSNVETVMLSKIYFLGLVEDKEDKKLVVDNIKKAVQAQAESLGELEKFFLSLDIPDEHKEIAKFQFETLSYGIKTYDLTRKWLEELERKL